MIKRYLFALLSTCLVVPVWAEWNEESPELEVSDSIVVEGNDTIEVDLNNDPEWYVPPISREVNLVPRRAVAASTCRVDSVRTFDIDSVLTEVTWYNYDKAGRIICTTVWTCNPDGTRVGKSKEEAAFDAYGTQVLTATYDWDNTTNDWHGLSRTEDVFNENGKLESHTIYEWVNNDWLDQTLYTYQYDEANREIEFLTYIRAANDIFELSKGRIREYNAAGRTTLDIQYSAYTNDEPTAGTKYVNDFDAKGNQILKEYYSSYNNGAWVGSTREVWEFIDNTTLKTYYEKKIWSNGTWVNNAKETWTYYNNTASKVILHETFSGSNDTWVLTLQENKGYDAAGNNDLVENYSFTNGVKKGEKKETYTFNDQNKKTGTYKYIWVVASSDWALNTWNVSDKDAAGNTIETANYNRKEDAWVGTGTRTLTTYNSNKKITEKITQNWPTGALDWENKTKYAAKYSGLNTTQEANYKWVTDHWEGTNRLDWHYNADGLNDTIMTFVPSGIDWIYSNRTVKTYKEGVEIMVHKATWNGSKWVLASMTRSDAFVNSDASGRQEMNASWQCGSDSVWIGITKDSVSYSATNKKLYEAHYTSWENNDWVPSNKLEYTYDEKDRKSIEQRFIWWSNTWRGDYRYEYGFDEQGNQNVKTSYNSWDAEQNKWIGSQKEEKVFDANKNVILSVLSVWAGNDWTPIFRYLYTYDASNREIEKIIEKYENDTWVNSEKYFKEYKGSSIVKNNSYMWLEGRWKFSTRSEYYYDNDAQAKIRMLVSGYWSNGSLLSFSNNLYFYSCDLFTVMFKNYDGTLLSSIEIENGKIPEYTGETPTKPENAQYTYTFKGWDPVVKKVTGNAVYTVDFDSIVKHYLILFKDKDGKILDGRNWDYGATPECAEPAKPANAQYTYSFKEWIPAVESVTQDAVYTADFDSVVNQYTIRFLDEDGWSELYSVTLDYGETPEYVGETPTKDEDESFTYAFKDWSPEIEPVTAEAEYKAEYTATPKIPTAVGNVQTDDVAGKVLLNGTLYIIRVGDIYTVSGLRIRF